MEWDPAFAREDLDLLSAGHDIKIHWKDGPPHTFYALVEHRAVFIGPPVDEISYLAALHEFGHILSPRALHYHKRFERTKASPTREYDDYAICEAAAWAWAARFCNVEMEITDTTWRKIGTMFASCLPYTQTVRISAKTYRF